MNVVAMAGDEALVVSTERDSQLREAPARVRHLRHGPRSRALCGHRAKDLEPPERDALWTAIPRALRCARCEALLGELLREEQETQLRRDQIRLELVRALLRALDGMAEINAVVSEAEDYRAAVAALT